MKKKIGTIDRPFLITLLVLVGIGLLMVFSASMYSSTANGNSGYDQFLRQSLFALIGLLLMFVMSRISYKFLTSYRLSIFLLFVTIIMLVMVKFTPLGVEVNDAKRWLNLGVQFQPSEIAKFVGIIYMANTVIRYKDITRFKFGLNPGTVQLWVWCYSVIAILFLIIAIEPSLSAALAVSIGMVAVLFFAGISMSQFVPIIVLGGGAAVFFLFSSWRWTRVLAFIGQSSTNYQISQSLLAFGSGQIFGVGLGNGKQKLLFLPEIQNDFIFANIGEEFGLFGCLVVLALFSFLIYRGYRIGLRCKNKFGRLYTLSFMTLLAFQVFVNIGVATQGLPVTGMALPFISYGGTSILILLISIGPILNISRSVKFKTNQNFSRSWRNRRSHLSGNRLSRKVKTNPQ